MSDTEIFAEPVGPWFRWYAWRPVLTTDRGRVWGTWVWRRRYQFPIDLDTPAVRWFEQQVEPPPVHERTTVR